MKKNSIMGVRFVQTHNNELVAKHGSQSVVICNEFQVDAIDSVMVTRDEHTLQDTYERETIEEWVVRFTSGKRYFDLSVILNDNGSILLVWNPMNEFVFVG